MPPARQTKNGAKARVLANRYQVGKRLGSGNFGTAYLVTDLQKDEQRVMKEIAVGDLQPDETVEAAHEANLLAKLDDPGIVKFHDSFLDGEYFCIITEYCEGGDLDQKISSYKKEGKRFTEQQVIEWTIQLLMAVQHMHSRRVLHRDLKTRNIFLKNNRIKIGDFGISRILMGTIDMASTFTGTPYYMSPEVLKHEGYNSKSDVWSVGCILYELAALHHAFEGQSLMAVMYKIVEGECPELPNHYSKDLSKFMKMLLTKDPGQRPSAGDALKTPFLAKHMERLHDGMVNRINLTITKDDKLVAEKTGKKARELRAEEAADKLLSPRERMRMRKLQAADRKGEKLREAAQVNYAANQTRQQTVIDMKYKSTFSPKSAQYYSSRPGVARGTRSAQTAVYSTATQRDSPEQESDDEDEGTILETLKPQVFKKPQYNQSPPAKHLTSYKSNSEDHDDDDDVIMSTSDVKRRGEENLSDSGVVLGAASLQDVTLRAGTHQERPKSYDERPITPMKDVSVYEERAWGEDGIPEGAELAETFYSQYADWEDGAEGVEPTDEELDMMERMERLLGPDPGAGTQTISDDMAVDAFGPGARLEKMNHMRSRCVQQLGQDVFDKVYKHIRAFRAQNKSADDSVMMRGLKHLVKTPSDAFLVDQLVFLELES